MASYESIGSCSLDVDITVSDSASELYDSGSVSERTLHSLNLSTSRNSVAEPTGESTPEYVRRTAKRFETDKDPALEDKRNTFHTRTSGSSLHPSSKDLTELQVNCSANEVTKKPSYLGLACSISGYTTITNYDSKLREGFRSRDHSPGRLVIRSRDASPLKFNQDHLDSATLRCRSDCGNFLVAPTKSARHSLNGNSLINKRTSESGQLVNGAMSNTENHNVLSGNALRQTSHSFMSTMLSTNSYSSTNREVTSNFQSQISHFESPVKKLINGTQNGNHTNLTNGSPLKSNGKSFESLKLEDGCPNRRSSGVLRVSEFTSHTKSYVNGQNECASTTTYSTSKFSESKNQFLESRPSISEQKSTFTTSHVTTESNPQAYQQNGDSSHRGYSNGNGSSSETSSIWMGGATSNKSFIQQRVERLYGPGALAQGFFKRTSQSSLIKEQSNIGVKEDVPQPYPQAGLPVLRHLRPEFRAQLSLGIVKKPVETEDNVTKIIPILQHQVSIESVTDILPAAPEVVLPIEQTTADIVQFESSEVKDGVYYLKVLKAEIDIINDLVEKTEKDMEKAGEIPEESSGKLRSVIGQARLLVKQKLQQFEGLCHKNMSQNTEEPFPTTVDDLAGFWDMVKLQVCQVHGLFKELEILKANNWQEPIPNAADKVDGVPPTSASKRRPYAISSKRSKISAQTPANDEVKKAREATRKKIMEERRREMREKKLKEEETVEIFVPQDNPK